MEQGCEFIDGHTLKWTAVFLVLRKGRSFHGFGSKSVFTL